MAVDKGWDGAVMVGANVVGRINEWTLDAAADVLEQTAFGDTYDRSYVVGMRGPHTFTGSGYSEDTDAAQIAVIGNFESTSVPAAATVILLTNNTTGSKAGYTGSGIFTAMSRGATPDGLQTFSFSGQFAGKLSTYAT